MVTLLSGGFTVGAGAFLLSSKDPIRPLLVAVALFLAARVLLPRKSFIALLRAIGGGRDGAAERIALAAVAAVAVVSIAWSSRAAGGSDSSCYVLQAEAFANGRVALEPPFEHRILPEATPAMFAPTGFVPSSRAPFTAVPICAPGLALAMAGVGVFGRDAIFLVVPVFAAAAVWLTFVLGRRIDDAVTGAAAALTLATSPIFLYQSVQPMSDVPATALWLGAVVLLTPHQRSGPTIGGSPATQIGAGVCASAAVVMRPNVALIVLPLLLMLPDWRGWLRFGLAAAPGLALMAGLNAVRHGSPLSSGYGSTEVLFSFAHVAPNLARYPRWLLETETPFLAAALLAPWWAWRHRASLRVVAVLLAAIVLTVATYLAYTVFDDWWYIRFLLPAIPPLIVLSVAVCRGAAAGPRRWPAAARDAVVVVLGAAVMIWHIHVATTHHVFELQGLESRFALAGAYVARALPASAVVVAVQQSGSVRYHGHRATISWDGIPPGQLDTTIAALGAAGRRAVIVLEDAEETGFRARFATQQAGQLDWPPRAELHARVRVRIYDPDDRVPHINGARIETQHIR